VEQIDFVTNYPLGIDAELLQAVRDLPQVSKHLHVPAQSGSDAILQRMTRHYTAAHYREMTNRIYSIIPNATMTSDFIVGFCGETDEDFEQTVELVKYCRFRNSFIFKYSERAGTKAAELYADDVPEDVKKYRNNRLLEVQIDISRQFV
jgi:tRNA-2-methylthio-N6-dimethylallyladenosine synthase